ncbi:hypothetical protein EsH8_XIV_000024 [Colletotrichum jinshuiense]
MDVAFGATYLGDMRDVAGISDISGPTFAAVPVRVRLDRTQTISGFLRQIQSESRDTIPFEQFGLHHIRTLSDETRLAYNFQTLVVVQPQETDELDGFGTADRWEGIAVLKAFSSYAINLICTLDGDTVVVKIIWSRNKHAAPAVSKCLHGLLAKQSKWGIVAILGVLKAGGAFVPIEPSKATERRERIIAQTGDKIIITSEQHNTSVTLSGESSAVPPVHGCLMLSRKKTSRGLNGYRPTECTILSVICIQTLEPSLVSNMTRAVGSLAWERTFDNYARSGPPFRCNGWPGYGPAHQAREKRQPVTRDEQGWQQVWARILKIDPVFISINDRFFPLGGDSIVAMKTVSQARTHAISLTVADIFHRTTTSALIVRAAWVLAIPVSTGTPDVALGTMVSGRNTLVRGIEHMTGPTVAAVPFGTLGQWTEMVDVGAFSTYAVNLVCSLGTNAAVHVETILDEAIISASSVSKLLNKLGLFVHQLNAAVADRMLIDVDTLPDADHLDIWVVE